MLSHSGRVSNVANHRMPETHYINNLLNFRRKSNDGGSRLFGEGSQEKDIKGILSDDSDDETLGFVFKLVVLSFSLSH